MNEQDAELRAVPVDMIIHGAPHYSRMSTSQSAQAARPRLATQGVSRVRGVDPALRRRIFGLTK
jgi:hypothetical protein